MDSSDPATTVVVGVDGTEDGIRAVRYAVAEAGLRGGRIRIVHVQPELLVVPPSRSAPLVSESSLHEVASSVVETAAKEARRLGCADQQLEIALAAGPRNRVLVEESQGAACLVLGRRDAPIGHLMTGSTTTALAAHADVPVVSVPVGWTSDKHSNRVVVGSDVLEATPVVRHGFEVARQRGAVLDVIYAWRPTMPYDAALGSRGEVDSWVSDTRNALTRALHDADLGPGVEWSVTVRYERPLDALVDESRNADLVVVGRHGRSGWQRWWIGSVARALLRGSSCPVMVVPTSRSTE